MEENQLRRKVRRVLSSQLFAVLATSKDEDPHCCLVSYAVTDDLKGLVFSTMRNRTKYRNMASNPRVSLLVDTRKNVREDVRRATTVAVVGSADETVGEEKRHCASILLRKHPGLKEFINSSDCAVMRVRVDKMLVVSNFESVAVLDL